MWVWQSQAPAGMSKFTGVDGCAALAMVVRLDMVTPAAMEARRIWRRLSIAFSPLFRDSRAVRVSCAQSDDIHIHPRAWLASLKLPERLEQGVIEHIRVLDLRNVTDAGQQGQRCLRQQRLQIAGLPKRGDRILVAPQ